MKTSWTDYLRRSFSTVFLMTVDGENYLVTILTQEVIDARPY
jgi:hypothetical protein